MGVVNLNNPSIISRDKEWKGTIAYDKSKDSKKVAALQRVLYGESAANAKNNKNIDGKWGENSKRRLISKGLKMSDDWNSYTDRSGNVFIWNGSNYVGLPKQVDPDAELWYNLSDPRLREAQKWINSNPGKGIRDWYDLQEQISKGNLDLVRVGAQSGQFASEELPSLAMAASARGDHHTATSQRSIRTTTSKDKPWINPSNNKRINLTQNDTVVRNGVTGSEGQHYPQNIEEGKLYRYNKGATRKGSKVGGQWTTESPVVWMDTDSGTSVVYPGFVVAPGDKYNIMQNMPGLEIAAIAQYIENSKGDPSKKSTTQTVYLRSGTTYFPDNKPKGNAKAREQGLQFANDVKQGFKNFLTWLNNSGTNRLKSGGKLIPRNK